MLFDRQTTLSSSHTAFFDPKFGDQTEQTEESEDFFGVMSRQLANFFVLPPWGGRWWAGEFFCTAALERQVGEFFCTAALERQLDFFFFDSLLLLDLRQ